MSGRLRPKIDAPPPPPSPEPGPPPGPAAVEPDDLAGIEAFAPHAEGSAEDPFVKAFAEARVPRHLRSGSELQSRAPRLGLAAAVVLLLCGVLAVFTVDGDDDRALATTSPTSSTTHRTTTTSRTATTRALAGSTTSTVYDPFTMNTTSGFATGTTVRSSGVTIRPLTSPTFPTTTAAAPNQDLTITFAVEPANPEVGQDVTITITYHDPDAPPTSNCRTIDLDGERLFGDPCAEPDCTSTGAAAGGGVGGSTEVTFHVSFTTAGDHDLTTYGQSVQPYCHDRYGDERTVTHTVTVADPSPTTPPPTTATPPVSL